MFYNQMIKSLVILIIASFFQISEGNIGFIINDLIRRPVYNTISTTALLARDKYRYELHTVTTQDNYVLTLLRILPDRKCSCQSKLPPVYLFHGLYANADSWLQLKDGKALPSILANNCYEVWLPNARGSTFSRLNRKVNQNTQQFWDFTWHDIALNDNPTNIDYILKKTNQTQLHYMGHSQGTTTFFVMTSLKTEYNEKIKTMHAMAPVALMKRCKSTLFIIASLMNDNIIKQLIKVLALEESLPNSSLIGILQQFCRTNDIESNLCYQIIAWVGGDNPKEANTEIMYSIFNNFPAGASLFQLLHYGQLIKSENFESYNWGTTENLKRYNQTTPIEYPVGNITAKMFFHVGANDIISVPEDINDFIAKLSNPPTYYLVNDSQWSHMDFQFGKNADKQVYEQILSDIKAADNIQCIKT